MHAKSLSTVYKYLFEGERIKTMLSGQLLYDCYEKKHYDFSVSQEQE